MEDWLWQISSRVKYRQNNTCMFIYWNCKPWNLSGIAVFILFTAVLHYTGIPYIMNQALTFLSDVYYLILRMLLCCYYSKGQNGSENVSKYGLYPLARLLTATAAKILDIGNTFYVTLAFGTYSVLFWKCSVVFLRCFGANVRVTKGEMVILLR